MTEHTDTTVWKINPAEDECYTSIGKNKLTLNNHSFNPPIKTRMTECLKCGIKIDAYIYKKLGLEFIK